MVRKPPKKEDEDQQIINWILEHADIKEIDDKYFREALYEGVVRRDSYRRFEIHNMDLIYCLRSAWSQKIIPRFFTEEEHSTIFMWVARKGIEIGVTNAIKSVFPRAKTQKLVFLGRSRGSMDLDLRGEPYELTTKLFYGSAKNPRTNPPPDKVLQLITYISADDLPEGKVKVYILLPPREEKSSKEIPKLSNVKKDIKRFERTWRVRLRDDYFKKLFVERSELLYKSLVSGDWTILPKAYFSWKCRYCSIEYKGRKMNFCEFLRDFPNEVRESWYDWNKERKKFILRRWWKKASRRDKLKQAFADTYDRGPTEQELDVFEKYLKMIEIW